MRGTELKKAVDGAVRKVQEEVTHAQAELRLLGGRVNSHVQEQSERAEELARVILHYLDDSQGEGETLNRLRLAMEAKNQEYERLRREERVLSDRLSACQTALARAQEEAANADEVRNNLEEQAEAKMLESETFAQIKSHREETAKQMSRAKEKLTIAMEDVQKKVPNYLSDPLFSYLLDRGYGEKEYRPGAIVRSLDGWVARLVKFNQYYPDFQRLKAIPEKIKEHIQWLEDRHADLSQQLEHEHQRILKEQTPEYGESVERFLAARVSEEALESEALDLEEKLQRLSEALVRIERGTDPATHRAISLIKEVVLGSENIKSQKLVQASSITRDDVLLEEVRGLDTIIQGAKNDLAKANREYEDAREKLREVESFHRRFQHAGLGRANRRHPSLRKGDVMETILMGHGLGALLRKMENQVRVISSSPSSSGSSRSRSSTGGFGGSRGSSGGGFGGFGGSTGGGFGGGRGRTGGGF